MTQRDPVPVPVAECGCVFSFPLGLWFQGPVHVVGCHHVSLSPSELSCEGLGGFGADGVSLKPSTFPSVALSVQVQLSEPQFP